MQGCAKDCQRARCWCEIARQALAAREYDSVILLFEKHGTSCDWELLYSALEMKDVPIMFVLSVVAHLSETFISTTLSLYDAYLSLYQKSRLRGDTERLTAVALHSLKCVLEAHLALRARFVCGGELRCVASGAVPGAKTSAK
jgi:hypothetical protein